MDDKDLDMKGEWNARARENARYYVATAEPDDPEAFRASGARDVALFFDGLEHLLHPDQTVLDIGCGLGRMDEHVAPKVGGLTGVDVSGEMVQQATERLAHLPNVRFVEVDGFGLAPIADASVGLVFSHIVFQHTPRAVTEGYFAEVFRVLRAGGDFVFQMPGAGPNTPSDPPETDTFEMRFWEEDDLRTRLTAIGFAEITCRRFLAGEESMRFEQLRMHAKRIG